MCSEVHSVAVSRHCLEHKQPSHPPDTEFTVCSEVRSVAVSRHCLEPKQPLVTTQCQEGAISRVIDSALLTLSVQRLM